MGAGLSRRRTAANTGEARAIHRAACFAGMPAPTGIMLAQRITVSSRSGR
ncbi:diguanylate cyclase [Pseudomonas plecoglossicida]|uniref:Diguanylate cyclase n=1 Tax=Pseudomonas plecoglossicida TaxID=70775 RepID=A0ABX4TXJ1_PSEDL|nr:diguanylate cyclase [Pseudomonas plecoglossicida]PLU91878.1 diguanylate cyclase [Pseudomonas plecoglossicida]PLV03807.1 diguanylate cyclase [Pseudomonas plecoglossicida]PLV12767.1 diguanylate cyclase [Pseudomonas plecoglossicida]